LSDSFSLMVHGGAGALDHIQSSKEAVRYLESIKIVLEHGRKMLQKGASALQTVETTASLLEDDPLYNAGYGSVLNENGTVEMDAGIMDGVNLSAGAIAGIKNVANPIQLATLVMRKSEHVMLIGEGATCFAKQMGVELVPDYYFYTPDRIKQHRQARQAGKIMLDHEDVPVEKYGTIGAVARDKKGNLAAATSTGGIVNKQFGRVGDTPLIGCGVYADNETCAVSATGYGEDFMRTVFAKTIADFIVFKGLDAKAAIKEAIGYLSTKVTIRGGAIVIDKNGYCASRFTTKKMIHGWIENGGETVCTFKEFA
jgi:beta-aspartyl-peptidase (threonine type)